MPTLLSSLEPLVYFLFIFCTASVVITMFPRHSVALFLDPPTSDSSLVVWYIYIHTVTRITSFAIVSLGVARGGWGDEFCSLNFQLAFSGSRGMSNAGK